MNKEKKYFFGLGRRKRAVAKVRIYPGNGKLLVNEKERDPTDFREGLKPLKILGLEGKFDVSVRAAGGGTSGWQGALLLGLSRALINYNPEYRATLKSNKLLTRDPREKERKKPGLKRARRAPQWQKR